MPSSGAQHRNRSHKLQVVPRKSGGGRPSGTAGGGARAELVSLPAGATNLPRDLSGFVGREREVAALFDLATSSPLVTVTGPAGIGKTRLALHVAARLSPAYADGVWLAELALIPATDDPTPVTEAVASIFGVRPEPGRSLIDAVVARLRSTSTLLVLDNCEHVSAATSALVNELINGCPNVAVMATSQHPLGIPGGHVFPVGPLSLPASGQPGAASDAVALFHARAKAAHPNFFVTDEGAMAVAEICRRLDGIPLAVELAAARTVVLSPVEIAEHLDERFGLLAQTGPPGRTPLRHQTLQAAMDWSYDLLPAPEKALFRRLSIFAGGAGLREVREVCTAGEIAPGSVIDLLSALVSKSLVVADTSRSRARYRLLETIRAYARQRLEEAGETEEVGALHAKWFVGLAEQGWHRVVVADQRGGADAIDAEHDNLRAALGWLLDHGEAKVALRMCSALTPFWKLRGHFREGREWLERSLAAGGKAASPIRGRALWGVGLLATMQGDLERATAALQEALALARRHDHQRAAIQALNLLGFISVFTEDPATALPLLEESVQLARADGDYGSLISSLALYGRARLFAGELLAAAEVFEECCRIARSTADGDDTDGLIGLGWVALARGLHDQAAEILSRILPALRDVDEKFETALVLSFLGELAWRRGDNQGARTLLDEGLTLAGEIGAPFPMARCLMGLARVTAADGDNKSAFRCMDEAINAARGARLSYVLVRCLLARGDLHRAGADHTAARAAFEEASEIAAAYGDRVGVADASYSLAGLVRLQGDYLQATSLYLESLTTYATADDVAGIAAVLEGLAGVAVAQNRAAHAGRMMGAAHGLRERLGCLRSPANADDYAVDSALIRAALPTRDFEQAWLQGASLSMEEILRLAARSRGGRRRPAAGWESLTPTEWQVVDLVAEGLTNPEIAERLFVSPRTVQGHISRVFKKVGVTSRRLLRDELRRRS